MDTRKPERTAVTSSTRSQTLDPVSGEAPASRAAPSPYRPVFTCAIDDVAYASLRSCQGGSHEEAPASATCDLCDLPLEDGGVKGVLMWTRGDDDTRFEEPALCGACATAIGVSALARWQVEEEEEG